VVNYAEYSNPKFKEYCMYYEAMYSVIIVLCEPGNASNKQV
jgi:hypothetical protein